LTPLSKQLFVEGEHYLNLGLTELAKEKFIQALEQNKSQSNEQGIGVCLFYLAQTAYFEKNVEEAFSFLQEAQVLYRRKNHDQMLRQLDILEQGIHDLADTQKSEVPDSSAVSSSPITADVQAEEHVISLESEVDQLRQEGNTPILAQKLLLLAQKEMTQRDYSLATQYLQEAHRIGQLLDDQKLQSQIHAAFEDITLLKNHADIDERSLHELLSSAKLPQDKFTLALSKAEILTLHNDIKGANEALHEARKQIPADSSKEKFIVLSLIVEFKLFQKQGLVEQADKILDYAKKLATKINDNELLLLVQQVLTK